LEIKDQGIGVQAEKGPVEGFWRKGGQVEVSIEVGQVAGILTRDGGRGGVEELTGVGEVEKATREIRGIKTLAVGVRGEAEQAGRAAGGAVGRTGGGEDVVATGGGVVGEDLAWVAVGDFSGAVPGGDGALGGDEELALGSEEEVVGPIQAIGLAGAGGKGIEVDAGAAIETEDFVGAEAGDVEDAIGAEGAAIGAEKSGLAGFGGEAGEVVNVGAGVGMEAKDALVGGGSICSAGDVEEPVGADGKVVRLLQAAGAGGNELSEVGASGGVVTHDVTSLGVADQKGGGGGDWGGERE